MVELMLAARKVRTKSIDFRAMDKGETDRKMVNSLRGILNGWYEDRCEPYCFDKCRGWLEHYPLLCALMESPKVIVPIRDIRGVVASMESRRLKNPMMETKGGDSPFDGVTIQSRVDQYLTKPPVGIAVERLFEVSRSGALNNMLVIRAEDLGLNPEAELHRVYAFLGLEWFDGHYYEGIASAPNEHDHVHAPYGEHTVRDTVQPPAENWDEVLGSDVSEDIKSRCGWFYETFYPERC